MKKLKLNLDELKVESFETVKNNTSIGGTVHAQATETQGPVETCYDFCITQAQTCDHTCWASCLTNCGDSCMGTC